MNAALQGWAHRVWRGEAGWLSQTLAVGISLMYRVVAKLYHAHYDFWGGRKVDGLTVVSVGNLAVGGTGKTPVSAWVARAFTDRGHRVALLSRGYGSDEIALHERWNPDIPVVVSRDRVAAAGAARQEGASLVVLDDGFQHRPLARDLDLVLLAAEDPFPGRLLPAGPYREPPGALERVHAIIVTRRTASREQAEALREALSVSHPRVPTAGVCLAPAGWKDLAGASSGIASGDVLAVTGIARPEAFFAMVEAEAAGAVEPVALGDHHRYTSEEADDLVRRAAGRAIAVTEKDAVKLAAYADRLESVRVLSLTLSWEWGLSSLDRVFTSVGGKGVRP